MTVRNLSAGGVLLAADGHDLAGFAVGTRLEVTLFAPGRPQARLLLRAEVVRHEPLGMALRWGQDGSAFVDVVSWLSAIPATSGE